MYIESIKINVFCFKPSVAPVSRNYQEMRDRLRNLYLLKKAKQNVLPTNDVTKQKDSNVNRSLSVHSPNELSQSSDKCGELKNINYNSRNIYFNFYVLKIDRNI